MKPVETSLHEVSRATRQKMI